MTDTTTLLREAADTIAAMWDRHAGGKLNIDSACTAYVNRAQQTLADLRAALAAPVEPVAQPVDASVPRADWEKMRDDLTRAKNLIVRLWNKHPEARAQIEGSTGSWFVWGQDRDATPPAQPAPAVQVVLRQPNLFAADPAAPAVREPQDERIRWRDAVIKEAESALRTAEQEFADMPTWANMGHAAKKVTHALAVIAVLGIGGGGK